MEGGSFSLKKIGKMNLRLIIKLGVEHSHLKTFGQLFENYISIAKFWATLFHSASYVLVLIKNGLGHILGDFFTNSYGHPGSVPQRGQNRTSPILTLAQQTVDYQTTECRH
jgi:hypothetical protein